MLRRKSVIGVVAWVLTLSSGSAQERGAVDWGRGAFGEVQPTRDALLAIPAVRRHLGLDEQQKNQIDDILTRLSQFRTGVSLEEFQSLNDEQRERYFPNKVENFRRFHSAAQQELVEELNDSQRTRLDQLLLQRLGGAALLRNDVAEKLGLGSEQKKQLEDILKKSPPPTAGNLRDMSEQERQAGYAEFRHWHDTLKAKMLGKLNKDQKKKFDEMTGEPFTIPEPLF